jgi:hypothetical protein
MKRVQNIVGSPTAHAWTHPKFNEIKGFYSISPLSPLGDISFRYTNLIYTPRKGFSTS